MSQCDVRWTLDFNVIILLEILRIFFERNVLEFIPHGTLVIYTEEQVLARILAPLGFNRVHQGLWDLGSGT